MYRCHMLLRFIDFQSANYTSPMIDLQYFLNTSSSTEVRINHFEELVEFYHGHMRRFMELLKCKTELPTLEKFKNDFKKAALYGFFVASAVLPIMIFEPPKDMPDLEKIMTDMAILQEAERKKEAGLFNEAEAKDLPVPFDFCACVISSGRYASTMKNILTMAVKDEVF